MSLLIKCTSMPSSSYLEARRTKSHKARHASSHRLGPIDPSGCSFTCIDAESSITKIVSYWRRSSNWSSRTSRTMPVPLCPDGCIGGTCPCLTGIDAWPTGMDARAADTNSGTTGEGRACDGLGCRWQGCGRGCGSNSE